MIMVPDSLAEKITEGLCAQPVHQGQMRRAVTYNGVDLINRRALMETYEATTASNDDEKDDEEGEEILLFHAFDKFCVGTPKR